GFVLTQADPFVGVDLDHCRDRETGAIEPWAEEIIALLWSYTEITPSGTGLRIFVRATLPAAGRKHRQIELYDHSRFLTVTGAYVPGAPTTIEDRPEAIRELHARTFPAAEPTVTNGHRPTPPVDTMTEEDRALVARATKAPNGMRFVELFSGFIDGY